MRRFRIIICLLCLLIILGGCGQIPQKKTPFTPEEYKVDISVSENQLADSLDRAVIQNVDDEQKTITFFNFKRQKSYTLDYDSSTGIKDRFDNELVAKQLDVGDVCIVAFLKGSRQIKNIWLDKTVVKEENLTQFEINRTALWVDVKDTRYAISDEASVIKDNKIMSLMDINEADTVTAYIDDHTILSFVISNEHGYVRLQGAENFVGGFVEFTQSIIRQVEDDMLIVLPSGNYDMFISNKNISGNKTVLVEPGQETIVDVSDLVTIEDMKQGSIIFTITPKEALLKIDGQDTDFSSPVSLNYGVHQMIVSLEGYKTITENIKVGQEMANINVEMEKSKTTSDESKDKEKDKSGESVSSNSTVSTVKDGNQVYVDAPSGAELYVEGKYIGLIPTSFDKKAGNYVLSIRKSGYVTRSYSLEIDDTKKDMHYSFSELEVSD